MENLRLIVTRHIDYQPDKWVVKSYPAIVDEQALEGKDIYSAKAEAMGLLLDSLAAIYSAIPDEEKRY